MSNSYGEVKCTREADLAAYDRCPPRLRWALAYAQGPWSAEFVLKANRRGVPEREIMRAMALGDRHDTLRHYGPTHPEAARHV